ncbi:hypothetical protein ACFV0H_36195 [Streptomyces erythrochromogenes]|uniref:hypothetical protein n=1 Tax=Streptomyces erythrochromogenes TaxID=285574 RepID=UPI003676B664
MPTLLGSKRRPESTPRYARVRQEDLDRQGVGCGLSLPDALEHLVAGHTGSDDRYTQDTLFSRLV